MSLYPHPLGILSAGNHSTAVQSIVVTSQHAQLFANSSDSALVTATAFNSSGNPIPGLPVSFIRQPSALGTLSTSSGTTNASGQASVTVTAGSADGVLSVFALIGGKAGSVQIGLFPPAGVPNNINVQATPLTLAANGTNTATITATVRDSSGNPVPGVQVTFSVDPSELGSIINSPAPTNSNGEATVTFRVGTLDGFASVFAVAGGRVGSVDIATLPADPIPDAVDLSASLSTIPGNGTASVTLTATVTAGGAPASGVTVNFFTTQGSGSFTPASSAVSDANGVASVSFTSSAVGSALIKAVVSGGTAEDTVQVQVRHPSADGLVWAVAPRHGRTNELTGGGAGTRMGSAVWTVDGLYVPDNDSGAYWAGTPDLYAVSGDFTLLVIADVSSFESYGKLLCVPYRDEDNWDRPWASFSLDVKDSGTGAQMTVTVSGDHGTIDSESDYISATDSTTAYAVHRTGDTGVFFRNAVAWGGGTRVGAIDWSMYAPVYLGNRNWRAAGEGVQGTFFYAFVWSRALSASELADIQSNPELFVAGI